MIQAEHYKEDSTSMASEVGETVEETAPAVPQVENLGSTSSASATSGVMTYFGRSQPRT